MIKVSIYSIAYNQKEYIEQCLKGMLMQKTNFDYEIVIHDDASTDGTAEIIKEYEQKYPKIIKALYEKENQYSKNKTGEMVRNMINKCNGKYIAICEGDDYWTDESKLQTQVDFLDRHKNYSGCFHLSERIDSDTGKHVRWTPEKEFLEKQNGKTIFGPQDTFNDYFIETCSVMYRLDKYKKQLLKEIPMNIINYDSYLIYFFSLKGKIKYINKSMSIKTINNVGIWNSKLQSADERNIKYADKIINFQLVRKKMYEPLKIITKDRFLGRFNKIVKSAIKLNKYDFLLDFIPYTIESYKKYTEAEKATLKNKYRKKINTLVIINIIVIILLIITIICK